MSRVIAFLCCIALAPLLGRGQSVSEPDVQRAIKCLQPDSKWERDFLRIHGKSVSYRVMQGGVPNTSDDRVPYDLITFVFYSQDASRAIVSMGAFTATDDFLMFSDEYHLRRVRGRWLTESGQGLNGTYGQVSSFVENLDVLPLRTLAIWPADKSTCVAESEWNVSGSKYVRETRPKRISKQPTTP